MTTDHTLFLARLPLLENLATPNTVQEAPPLQEEAIKYLSLTLSPSLR